MVSERSFQVTWNENKNSSELFIFCFAVAKNRLQYRYETKYRTATIMEEDALNQPTAQGTL